MEHAVRLQAHPPSKHETEAKRNDLLRRDEVYICPISRTAGAEQTKQNAVFGPSPTGVIFLMSRLAIPKQVGWNKRSHAVLAVVNREIPSTAG